MTIAVVLWFGAIVGLPIGTLAASPSYNDLRRKMRSNSNNLQSRTWLVLVISSIVLAYPFVRVVVPAVVHAVVPEVVRTVLNVL